MLELLIFTFFIALCSFNISLLFCTFIFHLFLITQFTEQLSHEELSSICYSVVSPLLLYVNLCRQSVCVMIFRIKTIPNWAVQSLVHYARVSTSTPTANMWCAHTTNPSNSIYLSFRSCDSCRRLPEPKHHSFLFNHWSASKYLVFKAARTPSIHVFLGRPLFLLSPGIQSIINFGSLSSCILLTWSYHWSLFLSMMSIMSGFSFTPNISFICSLFILVIQLLL